MAEDYVGKDQFNEFVKRMEQGFHHADQRHTDLLAMIDQRFAQMDQRFAQADQRHTDFAAVVNQRFAQVDQQLERLEGRMERGFTELRLEMDRFRNTTTRQLWVMVGILSSAIIGTLIKLLFFPSS